MKFHQRLAAERKRLRMTQGEFAEACGVKPPTQFLYEKGDRSPSAEYLMKAAKIGVEITTLFYGEHESLSGIPLPPSEMAHLYIECDLACRDEQGRLLDLEERVRIFKEIYIRRAGQSFEETVDQNQRVKKS